MNALISTKKILASLVFKKHYFVFILLVDNCILMYLKTKILYNFLILYGCLRVFFYFYFNTPVSANLKS